MLDVNVLLAAIWSGHPLHERALAWLVGKNVLLCPLTELGFLRISSNRSAIGARMEEARKLLEHFHRDWQVSRISDDLDPLKSHPKKSEEVTDHYLAELADAHGAKLGTFDTSIKHVSAETIP